MSRIWVLIAAALAGAIAARAAIANDSVAAAEAGGLVLRQTRDIVMVSEDLYVSAREIRVRYVFRNRSRRPVRTLVAFPMPDRDLAQSDEGDTAWPSDFSTRVDGRQVRMQVERRALVRGVDRSAVLRSLNVPIVSPGEHPVMAATEAIDRLTPAQQRRLESLGLVEGYGDPANGGRRQFNPLWTVRETWHWEQVFPAGRDLVVDHRYTPGAGGAAGTGLLNAESRQSQWGRSQIARYCVDSDIIAALERLARRTGSDYPAISETWISYVLTTGANWAAPIGDFRLVVDKGDPRNLVSFCGEGVRRIGPTQFEMRRRNWRPTRDLHVLILRELREGE
jgi:hypothetical protein